MVPVEHLGAESASKTLGSMTAPSSPIAVLVRISDKAQLWIDTAKNAQLSWRNMWFLVDRQFWPKVGFGIGMISASFDELTKCLHRQRSEGSDGQFQRRFVIYEPASMAAGVHT